MKDEGGRMRDEVKTDCLTSSFILPPSSLLSSFILALDCFDEAAHELEAFAARRCFNAAAHVNRVRADGLDSSRDVIRREAASEEESGHDLARAARERPVERVPRAAPSVRDEGVEQHSVRP